MWWWPSIIGVGVSLLGEYLFILNFCWSVVDSCVTILCSFLLCSKANQLFIHTYPLFSGFPSHLGHRRALNRVPCAISEFSLVIHFIHKVKSLSRVRLFPTPWTVAHQAPLSMGFSTQEYWSGLPFPSPGDLPDPRIEPRSPALRADTLTSEPPGEPILYLVVYICQYQSSNSSPSP